MSFPKKVSPRQIVKCAEVTTGAFYGYFSSKEALFASIVEPHDAALMGKFMEAQLSFAELPEEEQTKHMGVESNSYIHWMMDYICQHRDSVKLLLCGAEVTSYEHFVHNMVEVEVQYTLRYMEVLRRLGHNIPDLNKSLCHIIANGMFSGIFEAVIHDIPLDFNTKRHANSPSTQTNHLAILYTHNIYQLLQSYHALQRHNYNLIT